MALNYWFHPPDNLDPSPKGFTHPYTSAYLPTLWGERRGWYEQQQQGVSGSAGISGKRQAGGAAAAATATTSAGGQGEAADGTGGASGSWEGQASKRRRSIVWDEQVDSPRNR